MSFNEKNSGVKMWSGRFREPLNKQFETWQRSFPFDFRLIRGLLSGSRHQRAFGSGASLSGAR